MFNPNTITKVTTTGFIFLSTLIGGVQPASAAEICMNESGFRVCVTPLGLRDLVVFTGHGYDETFKVQCRNSVAVDWESYGNMSENEAQTAVNEYCGGREDTAFSF